MAVSRFNAKSHVEAFEEARQGWLDILVKNPNNTAAAEMIVKINAKLDLIRTLGFTELMEEEV